MVKVVREGKRATKKGKSRARMKLKRREASRRLLVLKGRMPTWEEYRAALLAQEKMARLRRRE